jgi:hypothetical protein
MDGDLLGVLFIIVLIALLCLPGAIISWSTQKTFDGIVSKLYVDGGNTYFVVIPDEGIPTIYENNDSLYFFKFNSGDILRDLEAGSRYRFHVCGIRVPFLSMFPNIISVKPLS